MRILVFNPGSSSLKFELIETGSSAWGEKKVSESIESFGQQTVAQILSRIEFNSVEMIVCRVVHGASLFREPTRVDADMLAKLEDTEDLAPLHNANSIAILRGCLNKSVPVVAVFDTAFHTSLPEVAYRYAIDFELAERHGIRRYGFHGISHKYLTLRYAEMRGIALDQVNIVTLHLGGGCSACAIQKGKSVDTSMGFTPLEGLMMGTRSGDIDPSLVDFLVRKEGVNSASVEKLLNKSSGLLGVSGTSQDVRVLMKNQDRRSQLALEMFAYRISKYVGAYLAALNGADAVIFSGGIGENAAEVRAAVCERLRWFGLDFDSEQNAATVGREGCISRSQSRLKAFVIPTQESLMMAKDAAEAVGLSQDLSA
jgi:acetate kinase